MARSRALVVAALAALLWLAPPLSTAQAATTVSITSSADNGLDKANASTNWGTSSGTNYVGASSSGAKPLRMIYRFDSLSTTVPAGAAVKSANLKIWKTQDNGTSRTVGAYRITSAWDELQSSWNNRLTGTAWTTAGGDFQATATSTTAVPLTNNIWATWNILADVQAWLTGTPNNGTLLKDTAETAGQWIRGNVREAGSNLPTLDVGYLLKVTGLTATAGSGQVSLSWTLPGGSPDYNGTLVIRRAGSAPTWTPTDGTTYTAGTSPDGGTTSIVLNDTTLATTVTDTGLTNGTTYYYQAFARDGNTWFSLGSATASVSPACAAVSDASYVSANAQSGQVTVSWPSGTNVVILQKPTTAFGTETPGAPGGATQVYSGSAGTRTLTATDGIANGTTYYFKVFVNGSGYSCGVEVNATPQAGTSQPWSYTLAGGSILKGAVAGWDGTISTGSNAKALVTLNTTTGAQSWAPVATTGGVQGYLTWLPGSVNAVVIGGDQSGWVYAVNAATGGTLWTKDLSASANAIQGGPAAQLRRYANPAFQSTYTTDVFFVPTRNSGGTNCGASTNNNKLFALRGTDGFVLWTFNGTCSSFVDYISGMPAVDYGRNRVYLTTGSAANAQPSFWVLDSLTGALIGSLSLNDLDSSATPSYDGNTIYVGNTAGTLYAINANATTWDASAIKWSLALGAALKGFVWEDYTTPGKLYLSTANDILSVQDLGASGSILWRQSVKGPAPIAGPQTPLLLDKLYVGSSDHKLHQVNILTGVDEKQTADLDGTTVGDVSTDGSGYVYAVTGAGKIYKIQVPLP